MNMLSISIGYYTLEDVTSTGIPHIVRRVAGAMIYGGITNEPTVAHFLLGDSFNFCGLNKVKDLCNQFDLYKPNVGIVIQTQYGLGFSDGITKIGHNKAGHCFVFTDDPVGQRIAEILSIKNIDTMIQKYKITQELKGL